MYSTPVGGSLSEKHFDKQFLKIRDKTWMYLYKTHHIHAYSSNTTQNQPLLTPKSEFVPESRFHSSGLIRRPHQKFPKSGYCILVCTLKATDSVDTNSIFCRASIDGLKPATTWGNDLLLTSDTKSEVGGFAQNARNHQKSGF